MRRRKKRAEPEPVNQEAPKLPKVDHYVGTWIISRKGLPSVVVKARWGVPQHPTSWGNNASQWVVYNERVGVWVQPSKGHRIFIPADTILLYSETVQFHHTQHHPGTRTVGHPHAPAENHCEVIGL